MFMKKKIAILIPCYNEALTVEKVVKDYKKAIPEADVYVYDNNSTDKTAAIAKKSGAIVVNEYRQGKGNVVRSQFRDIEADAYLMIDGDNTYPAEHAQEMVDLVLSGRADMVIGDRLSSTYFKENKRFGHNFGNVLVRFLINKLFKSDIHDIMTGQRAFSRDFVKTYPVLSKGFEIETEMTIHALDKNLKLIEIPIDYRDRPEGSVSKLDTLGDGFLVLKTIFNLVREYKPLFFFGWSGFISFVISGAIIIPTLIDYTHTEVLRFPTFLVGIIFIIIALLLWITGLILDLIAKKHRQLFEINLNLLRNKNG
jgi:Glycosyltransferases, probably involved in cell wall biogenesis